MEMPDVLSAHILEFVRERLRRNWPLVLAFEIRTGRRELQRAEFVAIMPYIGDNPLTNASREPLWLGKGGDMICSGGRSCDPHRIQWLQHTTFKGSSCRVESSYNGLVPVSSIVAAYSIQSIFPIGGLALASSVQHVALHLPHSQCRPPFCTCLHPLVRVLAVDTVQS